MQIANFAFTMADSLVQPPMTVTSNIQMLLRWIHFLAGITWIGLLYFFNLVNAPFLKELDLETRGKIVPALMSRALWWFRWSALVTVLAGLAYWMMIASNDARTAHIMAGSVADASTAQKLAHAHAGTAIGTFFGVWIVVFVIEYALVMVARIKNGGLVAMLMVLVVIAASWIFLRMNNHGWESNQLLSIGIGGGIGVVLLLNVWGIIWRIQKKLIGWTRDQALNGVPMPSQAATLAHQALVTSSTSAWLTIPLLFFMGAASHYPLFGK